MTRLLDSPWPSTSMQACHRVLHCSALFCYCRHPPPRCLSLPTTLAWACVPVDSMSDKGCSMPHTWLKCPVDSVSDKAVACPIHGCSALWIPCLAVIYLPFYVLPDCQ